jgi:hypothetical protein
MPDQSTLSSQHGKPGDYVSMLSRCPSRDAERRPNPFSPTTRRTFLPRVAFGCRALYGVATRHQTSSMVSLVIPQPSSSISRNTPSALSAEKRSQTFRAKASYEFLTNSITATTSLVTRCTQRCKNSGMHTERYAVELASGRFFRHFNSSTFCDSAGNARVVVFRAMAG